MRPDPVSTDRLPPHGATVVSYCINGAGVGHLTRQIAINRALREVARERAPAHSLNQVFLTTSEAYSLLSRDGFRGYTLLSPGAAPETGLDTEWVREAGRELTLALLRKLKPDWLIVDTYPNGCFGELEEARSACGRMLLVARNVRPEMARQPWHRRALEMYDTIVIPHEAGPGNLSLFPDHLIDRVQQVGPIFCDEDAYCMSRRAARASMRVAEDKTLVYVSAGGGGDAHAAEHLRAIVDTVLKSLPDAWIVVGRGMLAKAGTINDPRVGWLPAAQMTDVVRAFDFAISASGYNTFHELMHFGIPTIFFAQQKQGDDQAERGRRGADSGAAIYLEDIFDRASLEQACRSLNQPELRKRMAENARRLAPGNHARAVAELVLHGL